MAKAKTKVAIKPADFGKEYDDTNERDRIGYEMARDVVVMNLDEMADGLEGSDEKAAHLIRYLAAHIQTYQP